MRSSVVTLCALLAPAVLAAQAATVAPADAPPRVVVAPAGEAGEALVVSGVVLDAERGTPLRGASVYVYQTDGAGYYTPGGNDSRNPRLRGYMRTDERGRYEFRTIRPGSYPGSRNPAHVHYVVSAPGYEERVLEIVFEGDPFLTEQHRAESRKPDGWLAIRQVTPDPQGGVRTTFDVRLRRR